MTTHLNHAINTFLIRTPFHGPTITATVSTDAPISPSFWQRQPTNLMAKIVQLQRCLTKWRPKKFLKMYGPPTTIAASLSPSFRRQRLTDPTDVTQKCPSHNY